ncbi:hypothetical protein EB796_017158 [Bugula neritina]|uniref:Uncharacterized protein n=1 Tax=Bugula neritina TaxID=10212 RepID=A0A7J7JGP1_BUGNE|nr:hypothetical protein EB796_017158 [Bugula neritina]
MTSSWSVSADSYAPGSCYYCLRTLSCKNLFLWMSLIISLIGWSVSIWRSIDSMDDMSHLKLRTGYRQVHPYFVII